MMIKAGWEEQLPIPPWGVLRDYRVIPSERFEPFSCGNDDADHWIKDQALKDCLCGLCGCHVCVLPDRTVAGFFALSPTEIRPTEELSRGLRGGIECLPVPAYLIGRLGVRTDLQGNGLGSCLVREALRMALTLARMGGGRLVLIDAKNDDLARWYEHLGFTRLRGNQLRLAIKMSRISKMLEEADAQ